MKTVNISDTDENADWIKSLPGHKDELKIHEALAKKRHGRKAIEPVPAIRGQPLPKDKAAKDWEVTEDDIAQAQAWVDKAMREAGYID